MLNSRLAGVRQKGFSGLLAGLNIRLVIIK